MLWPSNTQHVPYVYILDGMTPGDLLLHVDLIWKHLTHPPRHVTGIHPIIHALLVCLFTQDASFCVMLTVCQNWPELCLNEAMPEQGQNQVIAGMRPEWGQCWNKARIRPMLLASAWFWPCSSNDLILALLQHQSNSGLVPAWVWFWPCSSIFLILANAASIGLIPALFQHQPNSGLVPALAWFWLSSGILWHVYQGVCFSISPSTSYTVLSMFVMGGNEMHCLTNALCINQVCWCWNIFLSATFAGDEMHSLWMKFIHDEMYCLSIKLAPHMSSICPGWSSPTDLGLYLIHPLGD